MGRIKGRVHLISTVEDVARHRAERPRAARLRHPDHAERRRHPRHHRARSRPASRGSSGPTPGTSATRRRTGRRRCARSLRAGRPDPGGGRAEQLELQPPARDRRGRRDAELPDRKRRGARSRLARRHPHGRHHRRRIGARAAGPGSDPQARAALRRTASRPSPASRRTCTSACRPSWPIRPGARRPIAEACSQPREASWAFRFASSFGSAPTCSSSGCSGATGIPWC